MFLLLKDKVLYRKVFKYRDYSILSLGYNIGYRCNENKRK